MAITKVNLDDGNSVEMKTEITEHENGQKLTLTPSTITMGDYFELEERVHFALDKLRIMARKNTQNQVMSKLDSDNSNDKNDFNDGEERE